MEPSYAAGYTYRIGTFTMIVADFIDCSKTDRVSVLAKSGGRLWIASERLTVGDFPAIRGLSEGLPGKRRAFVCTVNENHERYENNRVEVL